MSKQDVRSDSRAMTQHVRCVGCVVLGGTRGPVKSDGVKLDSGRGILNQ